MQLSFVVPCYNEQDNVEHFFTRVNNVISQKISDYEFVFVDDGSSDKTYTRLAEIYNANPRANIQVISFSRNFGKEAAMYAGLKNAKGEMVCIIDADLQQEPETVVQMLDEIEKDDSIDCVCAYQDNRNEGKLISSAKKSFYKTINKMSDIEFVNGASDFRLMRKNMVDAILEMTEYHRFSKGIFSWVGFNTKYISYTAKDRHAGESKFGVKNLLKYGLDGIFAFSTMPLKLATYIGFFTSIASIIYLIAVVIEKLCFGIDTKGYATIVVLILLLGGIQLFSIGILGEYISKMYIQTKNRPIYIEKKHLGADDEER